MDKLDSLSIKEKLKKLRENYYLQSLTEQDPESAGTAQSQMVAGVDTAAPTEGMPPIDSAAANAGGMPPMDPMMGGGMDPYGGMSGMMPGIGGAPEPIKTAKELGRIYELNKIYMRLYVIHKILSSVSDSKLQNIRDMTSEAFEIFRLILNNIKSYVGIIDDIILQYYQFLSELVTVLDIYFKANSEKEKHV